MSGKRQPSYNNSMLWSKFVSESPQAVAAPLRKALTHRSNYIVAKAADLVREFHLPELIPDLFARLDRCFVNFIKTDPQVLGKERDKPRPGGA